eukprot:9464685-Pyramimonas_sp.AAC.1
MRFIRANGSRPSAENALGRENRAKLIITVLAEWFAEGRHSLMNALENRCLGSVRGQGRGETPRSRQRRVQ